MHIILIARHQSERYAGQPSELSVSDLPTYKQIIQYAYKIAKEVFATEKIDSPAIVLKASEEIVKLWNNVNPNLPLIS